MRASIHRIQPLSPLSAETAPPPAAATPPPPVRAAPSAAAAPAGALPEGFEAAVAAERSDWPCAIGRALFSRRIYVWRAGVAKCVSSNKAIALRKPHRTTSLLWGERKVHGVCHPVTALNNQKATNVYREANRRKWSGHIRCRSASIPCLRSLCHHLQISTA